MTVAELKEYLNNFDDNLDVEFWSDISNRWEPVNENTLHYRDEEETKCGKPKIWIE